jgi:general secretion pathway protein D
MVLLITPRILQKPEDSENLRRGNNDFYKSLNNGFPDTQPYPNKFIEDKKEPDTTPVGKAVSRQQLYYEMSKYAAEMVRVPEIERTKSDLYIPATVKRVPTTLFDDRRITATPEFSWNRGGLYVTAVRLSSHDMSNNVAVNYQNVAGKWLASSIENTALAPAGQSGNSTYLYLISALPFNEVVATN